MKKILIIVVLIIVLGIAGFFVYKYFASKNTSSGGTPTGTQLCDIQKQTCVAVNKTSGSGSVSVKVFKGSGPANGLEVDLGAKAGAPQYYMKTADDSGVALFEGIPAGSYTVYFNLNAFPAALGNPQTQNVVIVKGQTNTIEIHLGQ
jgi:uncharacterized protein YxeA